VGNQTKIIRLFQEAQKQKREGRSWRPVVVTVGVSFVILLLVASFLVVQLNKQKRAAARAIKDAKKQSEVIANLQEENNWFREEAERRKQVRFLERNLQIRDVELGGSGVSGYVQNSGTEAVADIKLTALVKSADGTLNEKTITLKSADGRPLMRWQRRAFRIVLDMDPGPGAEVTVYIDDVQALTK